MVPLAEFEVLRSPRILSRLEGFENTLEKVSDKLYFKDIWDPVKNEFKDEALLDI